MANTLTRLIADSYKALDRIGRELTGFIPSVTWDPSLARGAINQDVVIPVTPPGVAQDIVPATTAPDNGDTVVGNETFRIQKSRMVPFRWEGEEALGLNNGGIGVLSIQQNQIAQAMRTLVNEIESDFAALYIRGSRAWGTSGTAPFGSGVLINDMAQARKILVDNGSGDSDLSLVMDTNAGVNIRTIPNLFKVNEAGDASLLRQGVLTDLYGVPMRESAQIKLHVNGTSNNAYTTTGTYAIGATAITVGVGAGTIVAGDVITFAGSAHQYQVKTALSGGVVVIGSPGLRAALGNGVAITTTAVYRANMMFHRSAILGAMRLPALPPNGDGASDRTQIQDPRTGLVFEIAMYPQYRRMRYEVGCAWGVKNIKDEHVMVLKG